MDGLECKVILLSEVRHNKDSRIDSAFYTMQLSRNRILRYEPIEKYLSYAQYGVSKDMNTESKGYPIFRMNELHGGLCDLTTDKYVELTNEDFNKTCLHDGDVLFNRTNSYDKVGRTGIYYSHNAPQTFASYLVRFIPDNINLLSEYLTAFLNSKYGIQEIRRRARQSINQTNVNPEEVKRILIPILDKKLQFYIKSLYKSADALRVEATNKYKDAETELANWLNIRIEAQTVPVVSEKTISYSYNVTGRLDAEYYQPKYDKLFSTLSKYTCKPLGGENGLVLFKKSIEPGREYYQSDGVPFIRVSDISKFEIEDPEIHLPLDIVDNIEDLYPEKDTILFSKDGSVGIAYKVEDRMEIITSGALLHLTIKNQDEILPDYLTLVLNSPIVQLQAERDTNGAIIQHWKPSEIEKVVIPVLDMDKQIEISDKVKESFALRKKSKQLLEDAKRAVELAIEQDEESAIEWLKDRKKEAGV